MSKPHVPPYPPLPPPLPDDGGDEVLRMTLGYHGDTWPQKSSEAPPRRPTLRSESDGLIREQLAEELENSDIDASGIEIRVKGGEVELSGVVEDARAMQLAMEIAQRLLGVEAVENAMQVVQKM